MKKVNPWKGSSILLLLLLAFLLPGCAHVISRDLRAQADLTLTLEQVLQNPKAYKGKIVLWGGELIQTINQKDRTTLVEVLQRPLDWTDEPQETSSSSGRFLILVESFLDPYIYRRGRGITVAGEILGEKVKPLGEMQYHYPLILSKQVYLWKGYHYQYLPSHPWGYYNPWWYGRPWWGPYWYW